MGVIRYVPDETVESPFQDLAQGSQPSAAEPAFRRTRAATHLVHLFYFFILRLLLRRPFSPAATVPGTPLSTLPPAPASSPPKAAPGPPGPA